VFTLQEPLPGNYEIRRFDLPDMSRREIEELLRKQLLCRISFNDQPYPYVLPMEYYYSGDVMYFHFTTTGKKMDLLARDPNVTVEIDWYDSTLTDYKSVILRGKLVRVENQAERNMITVAMSSAVREKAGIKSYLEIPWGKKGIDYLAASNIPLMLLRLDVKDISAKKAH
jgi:hypothetical protein